MDQVKIGKFLAELRKENEMTQEQLAEKLNVARRTISRWETGNNMPDIDILIDISDLYEVDLREILNGERKSENMENATKETVLQAVDFAQGASVGMLFCGIIMSTRYCAKVRAFKQRLFKRQ